VFHRSLIHSSTLGELTPSAEGPSLSLAVKPATGYVPTDLAVMVAATYIRHS
jgi:hypothetical protein